MVNEAVRRRASTVRDASKPLSLEYMGDRLDVVTCGVLEIVLVALELRSSAQADQSRERCAMRVARLLAYLSRHMGRVDRHAGVAARGDGVR